MKKALCLCLLFLGCGPDRLSSLEEDFFVEQTRINVGHVYTGRPREVIIHVESRARYAMTLNADGRELVVPAGGVAKLDVEVLREAEGAFEQTVLISGERQSVTVVITGEASLVPECVARNACVRAYFDFEAGECAEENLPEDTACGGESACVTNGHCEAGECRGEAVSCDDGNACTTDACAVGEGCVHMDSSARCAATSPCSAGFCDPATGCQTTEVADGTSCGTADCTNAHVCMSGACVERPVPDGASCGGSPCQGAGRCVQGSCVQPDATTLQPVWSYVGAPGKRMASQATTDELGNLFFTECDTACELVSLTPASAVRFRVSLTSVTNTFALAVSHGRVVVSTDKGELRIHDTVTGAKLATVDTFALLQTSLLPMSGSPTWSEVSVNTLAADNAGRIYAIAAVYSFQGDTVTNRGVFLMAVDDASGTLLWKRRASHFSGLVLNESGRLFTSEWPVATNPTGVLLSLDANGNELYSIATSEAPIATHGGMLFTSYGTLRNTSGGDTKNSAFGGRGGGDWVLMRNDDLWTVFVGDCFPSPPMLTRASATTGQEAFNVLLTPGDMTNSFPMTAPLLTKTDSVVMTIKNAAKTELVEVNYAGDVSFRCELGDANGAGAALLGAERYVIADQTYQTDGTYRTTLRAYALPGTFPAVSGWIAPGGGPQHASKPR